MRHFSSWLPAQLLVAGLLHLKVSSSTEASSASSSSAQASSSWGRRRSSIYASRDEIELQRLERELEFQDKATRRPPRAGRVGVRSHHDDHHHHSHQAHMQKAGSSDHAALEQAEQVLMRGSRQGSIDTALDQVEPLLSRMPNMPDSLEQVYSRGKHETASSGPWEGHADSRTDDRHLLLARRTKEPVLKTKHSVMRREEPISPLTVADEASPHFNGVADEEDTEAVIAARRNEQKKQELATWGQQWAIGDKAADGTESVVKDKPLPRPVSVVVPASAIELSASRGASETAVHKVEAGANRSGSNLSQAVVDVMAKSAADLVTNKTADSADKETARRSAEVVFLEQSEKHSLEQSGAVEAQSESALEAEAEDLSTGAQITTKDKVNTVAEPTGDAGRFMMVKSESVRANCFLKCLEHNPVTNKMYVAGCHKGANQMWKLQGEALVYEYNTQDNRQCQDFWDWRKASQGVASEIFIPGKQFGFVAASWDDCRATCFSLTACKQAVFSKGTRSCKLFKAALSDDQDGRGGENIEYISAQCDDQNNKPQCLEYSPTLDRVSMADCNDQVFQKWYITDRQIRSRTQNQCLVLKHMGRYGKLENDAWNEVSVTKQCDKSDSNQRWHWS